ncbi:MAG TPA: S8 family serine peptidase [Candidatus Binatia bacterium]|nr:S8 family serine peptidase [Candidatus Binatia bacterium]
MTRLVLLILALALTAPAAHAQLGLPQLPNVGGAAGDVLNRTANTANQTLDDVDELTEARTNQVRSLLRRHRRELEADPNGQPIVRSQILVLAPSAEALERARAEGFEVVQSDELDGGPLVVLRAPRGLSTRRALDRLREADPQGVYDFDHLHLESGIALSAPAMAQQGAAGGPRIGLIDGGVSNNSAVIAQRAFSSTAPVASTHGAAVASLLARAAPGTRIVVADIYGGAPTGGSSAALARALSWLGGENVPVINVSLVGPRNRIVEAMVARVVARGIVIVAAVGNDGPAAAPLYPSAYNGVIGVTGVDARGRVLMEAVRGPQVDFAALGIHSDPRVRGTSFAAPIVAGYIAQSSLQRVRSSAQDLGPRGRDDVYGQGLVGGNLLSAAR